MKTKYVARIFFKKMVHVDFIMNHLGVISLCRNFYFLDALLAGFAESGVGGGQSAAPHHQGVEKCSSGGLSPGVGKFRRGGHLGVGF